MNSIIRTAVAILCGFLAITIVVLAGTLAATALLMPGGVESLKQANAPLSTLYLTANLGVSLAAAVVGGWLASRLDSPGGWRPVIGLAVLVAVMWISNQAVPSGSSGAPVGWYPWAIVAIGVGGAIAGGWLRRRDRAMGGAAVMATNGVNDHSDVRVLE